MAVDRNRKTKRIALGGILSALSVAILWLGSLLPGYVIPAAAVAGLVPAAAVLTGSLCAGLAVYGTSGLLAMLLLPGRFTRTEMEVAFDFYDGVTTHDSSLYMAAFSAVASRIGRTDKAYRYFRETARLDLDDTHGNTRDGLHMANMAGTWVCMTAGFGGMQVTGEDVSFAPILPPQLKGYGFRAMVRGRLIEVRVDDHGPRYTLVEGEPITILDRGERLQLN